MGEDITSGKGKIEDIDLLIELGEAIKAGSLLRSRGRPSSPTRSFSTIRSFREEYEAHIKKLHYQAAVRRGLVKAPSSGTLYLQEWCPPLPKPHSGDNKRHMWRVIKERLPFPSVYGYVCFHPCEENAVVELINKAVAIKALKRFVADHATKFSMP